MLVVGTHHQIKSGTCVDVKIAGVPVPQSTSVKLLGVTFDQFLSFNDDVSEVCRASAYHLKAFRHIRKFLDKPAANIVACSYIASRLDYCNAVIAGVSQHNLMRLQRIQNKAAKIALDIRGTTNSSYCLKELHWLPVAQRIDYKIALTVFKTLQTNQPVYIRSMLSIHHPTRSLRSSDNGILLNAPFCKTATAARAFSLNAPRVLNSLPMSVRDCFSVSHSSTSIETFKKLLKTFLFTTAFGTGIA